jgi:hypothetical protein
MFVERDDQPPREVRVDSAHMLRQAAELRRRRWTASILDEDERILMGQFAARLRKPHEGGSSS